MFKAFKKMVFKLEDIAITKEMTVGELKKSFHDSFGTSIKVYKNLNTGKGARVAPDETLLDDLKGEDKVLSQR